MRQPTYSDGAVPRANYQEEIRTMSRKPIWACLAAAATFGALTVVPGVGHSVLGHASFPLKIRDVADRS